MKLGKKYMLIFLLAFALVQAVSIVPAVQAVSAIDNESDGEVFGTSNSIEEYSLEEMIEVMPDFYEEGSLTGGDEYNTRTILVEANEDGFNTYGASDAIQFNGIYMLTYDTGTEAKLAYRSLIKSNAIEQVEVDAVLETAELEPEGCAMVGGSPTGIERFSAYRILTGTVDWGVVASKSMGEYGAPEGDIKDGEESVGATVGGVEEGTVGAGVQATRLKEYLDSKDARKVSAVAIIDTGYSGTAYRIVDNGLNLSSSGEDAIADDNGHGTKMAEIVLDNTPEAVKVMPIKAANNQGKATILSTYLAIQVAMEQGVDTILISMNAKASDSSLILAEAIKEATSRGIQVVVSAGNNGIEVASVIPSNIEEAIVVSAVNDDGSPATYSNYGTTVDYSSYGTYQGSKGTSNAAAYVCAAVAWCRSVGEHYGGVLDEYGVVADSAKMIAFEDRTQDSGESDFPGVGIPEDDDLNISTAGSTYYNYKSGYFNVTVAKGSSSVTYKVSCSVPIQDCAVSQVITYSVNSPSAPLASSVGMGVISGTYKTEADGAAGQDLGDGHVWLVAERQYIFPVKLSFNAITGYTLKYDSSNTATCGGSRSLSGRTLTVTSVTNGLGMTLWCSEHSGSNNSTRYYNSIAMKYTANTYSIKYHGNGNTSGSMSNSSHTYDDSQNLTDNSYLRTGYSFDGWDTKSDGSGTSYANKASVKNLTSTHDDVVDLYAQWTANPYTVVYNGNGNTGGSTAGSSHTYGTYKNLTSNGYTKTGHTFKGWATTSSGSKAYDDGESVRNLTSTAGGTVTLYAVWERNKYTVTYNYSQNGGASTTTASAEVYYEYAVSLTPTASKTGDTGVYSSTNTSGWQFVGWNNSSTATTALSSLTMGAGNITLYAIYKKVITATYKDYLGTAEKTATVAKTVYNNTTTADCSNATKNAVSGWTHDGWATGTAADSAVATSFVINKNTTYYGRYSRIITQVFVNFKSSNTLDGTQYRNSYAINTITGVALTVPGIQTKSAWTKIGWSTSPTSYVASSIKENQTATFTESGTYYSIYCRDYSIRYEANGGLTTPNTTTDTAYYNASGSASYTKMKTASPISKYGEDFVCWNTSDDGTGTDYKADSVVELKMDMVLYAKFNEIMSTILQLSDDAITITTGETMSVETSVKPMTAKSLEILWETADDDVATVDSGGVIKGVSPGMTMVTATLSGASNVQVSVSVTVVACAVRVPATMVLNVPTVLSVRVYTNDKAKKTAKLTLNELSSLSGEKNGGNYALKLLFSDDGNKFSEAAVGDAVITTKGYKESLFKVSPLLSTDAFVPDNYTAKLSFRLELD